MVGRAIRIKTQRSPPEGVGGPEDSDTIVRITEKGISTLFEENRGIVGGSQISVSVLDAGWPGVATVYP